MSPSPLPGLLPTVASSETPETQTQSQSLVSQSTTPTVVEPKQTTTSHDSVTVKSELSPVQSNCVGSTANLVTKLSKTDAPYLAQTPNSPTSSHVDRFSQVNIKREVDDDSNGVSGSTTTTVTADNRLDEVNSCGSSSSSSSSVSTSQTTNEASDKITTTTAMSDTDDNKDDEDEVDYDLLGKNRQVFLKAVNPHIICNLCQGYLIDATTIVECLHSFCHSCIVKHLRTEQYCPRCEVMINTKPKFKPDTTLQAIVYKLVPGLYEKELLRKRAFYRDRPEDAAMATPEQRGEDTEHLIFSPSEYMSLSLEYADIEDLPDFGDSVGLNKPKYLQCPAIFTVSNLKKFVVSKFGIDAQLFNIEIMYKVKTILLLDHYTLMDVAYIYTWKRDAPMRFFFRVKEAKNFAKKRLARMRRMVASTVEDVEIKKEVVEDVTVKQEKSESPKKLEIDVSMAESSFEIVQSPKLPSDGSEPIKITLVKTPKSSEHSPKSREHKRQSKDNSQSKSSPSTAPEKDERKVENIKLKIDLSKQNSVTIINMSDPERNKVVKPVKSEKEWKIKVKKDKSDKFSVKLSPSGEKKGPLSPLTVPPLTIKAERMSPTSSKSAKSPLPSPKLAEEPKQLTKKELDEEEKKSEFLESFALAPTKSLNSPEKKKTSPQKPTLMGPPTSIPAVIAKLQLTSSKRKSKEPVKLPMTKKPKIEFSRMLTPENFKEPKKVEKTTKPEPVKISLKISPPKIAKESEDTSKKTEDEKLMPAPSAAIKLPKKPNKPSVPKIVNKPIDSLLAKPTMASPGSLTPHPMFPQGITTAKAAPGNRTPIAKRYQPILPKQARPNPFANIPSAIDKILQGAGTEIKSIPSSESTGSKVYGPKPQSGAPASPASNGKSPNPSSKSQNNSNYLNYALFNASKTRGNEAPPGCRTPMYTPNSPIYSPNSPSYSPNYNIPTMPTYKYTPKPQSNANNYLQSVLGGQSKQMSSLFPAPPTKKTENQPAPTRKSPSPQLSPPKKLEGSENTKNENSHKRVYPFANSPPTTPNSPSHEPPEKQIKVKSLLTSCNINIPSSLSITITNEDSETKANNANKNPVNNYIEILKLPELPIENDPKKSNGQKQPTPNKKENSGERSLSNSPSMTVTKLSPVPVNPPRSSPLPMASNTSMTKTTTAPIRSPPIPSPAQSPKSKTPSPEKKSVSSASNIEKLKKFRKNTPDSPNGKQASKSPTETSAPKKFRPILPRTTSPPDTINNNSNPSPPKLTASLPVAAKASKSLSIPSPQTPNSIAKIVQKPIQKPTAKALKPPIVSGRFSPKQNGKPKTPNNNNNNNNSKKSPTENRVASPKTCKPAVNSPPLPMLAAAQQQQLFSEQLFRQAQAIAASGGSSNGMFYTMPASAAASQFGTMYNFQQAYILEQLSRMQKAGREAVEKYMSSLKTGEANGTPPTSNGGSKSPPAAVTEKVAAKGSK